MKRSALAFAIFALCIPLDSPARAAVQVIHANDSLPSPIPTAKLDEWTSAPQRLTVDLNIGDTTLRGWQYSASNGLAPIVLVFGGNGYAIESADRTLRGLSAQGATVLEYDYRGYGFSGGNADVEHMRSDAIRLFDATSHRFSGQAIIVLGYSLGSIFASYVASVRHVGALILISPLASTSAEVGYLLKPGTYRLAPDSVAAQDVVGFVSRSRAPLLVVHGEADKVIPIQEGRQVFAASASRNKSFVAIPGIGHAGMLRNRQTLAAIKTFLHQFAPGR